MTYSERELEFTFAKNRLIFGKVKAYKNGARTLQTYDRQTDRQTDDRQTDGR